MSAAGLADPARLFVGVALDDVARAQVAALLVRVRALVVAPGWQARLPADDDLHITLRFLGAVARSRLPALEAALEAALAGAPDGIVSYGPIEVLPDEAGPRAEPPKHAWLCVGEGASFLATLAARADRACVAAGLASEREDARAFRPHITLVRVDHAPDDARASLLALEAAVLGSMRVAEVTLFESLPRTRPGAAHYTSLAKFPLRAQVVDAHGAAH